MTELLTLEMRNEAERLFQQALAAREGKDESIEAGQKWTDS